MADEPQEQAQRALSQYMVLRRTGSVEQGSSLGTWAEVGEFAAASAEAARKQAAELLHVTGLVASADLVLEAVPLRSWSPTLGTAKSEFSYTEAPVATSAAAPTGAATNGAAADEPAATDDALQLST